MTINEAQDEIIEEFEVLEEWLDRYQLLVDYGKELEKHPMPEADKNDRNKIDGCQSTVWFTASLQDGKIHYQGDSDAILVKGIVALLLSRIGLREHLSPTRSNGIAAMLKQMRLFALAYQAK